MNLQDVHNFMDYMLHKERGAFVSPEEKDDLLDRAQWWLTNEELEYYARTQQVKDSLATFSTRQQYVSSTTGLVTLPDDYNYLLSMYVQYYNNPAQRKQYKPIKFINEDELAERLNSQILEPKATDPVGIEVTPGSFQLFPEVTLSGYCMYLRKPVKPRFQYTGDPETRDIVYDEANSTQLEWNQGSLNKIMIKALQLAGVNITDDLIIQYTAQKAQENI